MIAEGFTVQVRFLSRAFLSNTYRTFLRDFIGHDSRFRSVILRLRQANHTRRFYALSPSEVCYLASSSATRVVRAVSRATFPKNPVGRKSPKQVTAAFMPRPTSNSAESPVLNCVLDGEAAR